MFLKIRFLFKKFDVTLWDLTPWDVTLFCSISYSYALY